MPEIKTIRRKHSAAAIAFTCSLIGAFGASTNAFAQAQADPIPNPLPTAKTIQVKEVLWKTDPSGKLKPALNFDVEISGSKQIKVYGTPTDPKVGTGIYITDGKSEHDIYGASNEYRTIDSTDGRQFSQIRYMASVDLIMNPPAGPEPNATRAFKPVGLDGKDMILRTDTHAPAQDQDGNEYVIDERIWFDAKTGYPYRRTTYQIKNGTETPVIEMDFSNWVVNKPIAASTFAFVPPAGSKELSIPTLLAAGATAPNFSAVTPDGKTVHLADFKGKTVVLDFWATWCHPCQEAMPHLESVYQQIKSKDNVVVLALCVWDKRPLFDKWVTTNIGTKYNFPVAFDPLEDQNKNVAKALYHVTGIPTQYVIDKDGKIAATFSGYREGDHKLEDTLRKLGIDLPAAQTAQATH